MTAMGDKRNLRKELGCYSATATPQVLDVPELQYLMVDGRGDPNTAAFADAVATLYPVAYTLKFASKRSLDLDYVVMPLEALWWAEDMDAFTTARDKSRWYWTLLTMVPDWITADLFQGAVDQVSRRTSPPRLPDLRLEPLNEGLCVQALHVGSFDDEAGLLQQIHHDFIPAHHLVMTGRHHEIYLSDVRRVEPARRRTILRQPVGPLTG